MDARAEPPRELTGAPGAGGFESFVRDVATRAVAPPGGQRRAGLGSVPVVQAGPGPRVLRYIHSAALAIGPRDFGRAADLPIARVQRPDAGTVRGLRP